MRMFCIIACMAFCCLEVQGQQAQEEETSPIPYAFPRYREATVTMMFGSKKQVLGNIYLDGSKFYFLQDSVPIEASLGNIHRVAFGDTLYMPVDNMLARIVAEDSAKMLVCVRTIDKYKMNPFAGRMRAMLIFALFPLLGLLCVLRYTIQGCGFTALAMMAGLFEMVARTLVGVVGVPQWGYTAVCFGDPMAWIAANIFLIPAYLYVYSRLAKAGIKK